MGRQSAFNTLMGLALVVLGWLLSTLSQEIGNLRDEDRRLADKLANLSTTMASQYVPKEDLRQFLEAIFKKLDRIEEKLDGKADRSDRR